MFDIIKPRYKIVHRTIVNQHGEIEAAHYLILKRRWLIFYFYTPLHGSGPISRNWTLKFETFKDAEDYLSAIHPAKKTTTIDKVLKEYL